MMKFPRRTFLRAAAAAAALPAMLRAACAQTYPARPVHIIVGFPAGSATDIVARLIAQPLSERLHQPVVIENRPGAGSNVGTEAVVRATPDGYTLLLATVTNAINATLYDLNFNFIHDIAPVAAVADSAYVMVVTPSFPAKTVAEFIAYAKANPGKIDMASFGNGTAPHVFGELFQMMAGINMVHVPYRSSPMPDLLAGRMQVAFIPISLSIALIKTGKLRALGVTGAARSPMLPDVPPVAQSVPGYEASGWYGIGAPKGAPAEVINALNANINAVVADPLNKARFPGLGLTALGGSPADFGRLIATDTEKWAKVVKFANIKPE
jgi:tripartite-type tricarboxylate transporter receptor subunit TctC